MPRLIFKCPHIKGGSQDGAHLKHYVGYIATRDGVERLSPEDELDHIVKRENYMEYIALRPRAQRIGAHGLFNGSSNPLVLSQVADAVAHHPGTVWLPIISLQREDAARLGYDNAESWRALLSSNSAEIAAALKIPWEQFRWYAAYHDEGSHPHVHMVCYSADGKSGYLTKDGIARIKTGLAKQIFRQELTELYVQQTQRRDDLTRHAAGRMRELIGQMQTGSFESERIAQLIEQLSHRLRFLSGKKQSGYLKAPLKSLVDEIVDELAKEPRVAAAYDLWYQMREEVLRTYKDDLPERLPLSQQKEFKRIKNLIIQEALKLDSDHAQPNQSFDEHAHSSPTHASASRRAAILPSVTRLLHHMGNIFHEQSPPPASGSIRFADSKLRARIREKKLALGHKADDHENEEIQLK